MQRRRADVLFADSVYDARRHGVGVAKRWWCYSTVCMGILKCARTHTIPFLSIPCVFFFIFYFSVSIFHFSFCFYVQKKYPDTLLCRFLGLYTLSESSPQRSNKAGGGNTYHFVVMANVFDTDLDMQERFDLKGSVYQRTVGVSEHDQARQ